MNKYFIQLFLKENTVILPGFGALMLMNAKLSEIVFLPELKEDDGKLANYISETEGVDQQSAQNTIAKFIREIESNLNKGESFDIFEFGSFTKSENGNVIFHSWLSDSKNEEEVNPEIGSSNGSFISEETIIQEASSNEPQIEKIVPQEPVAEPEKEIKKEELKKDVKLTEHMDSIALIQALLNDDNSEEPIKEITSNEISSTQPLTKQETFVPIVKTSSTEIKSDSEEFEPVKKKKRRFPFWFFFALLALGLAVSLIWCNLKSIQQYFSYKQEVNHTQEVSKQKVNPIKKDDSKSDQGEKISGNSKLVNKQKPESFNNSTTKNTKNNENVTETILNPIKTSKKPVKVKKQSVEKPIQNKSKKSINSSGVFQLISGAFRNKKSAEKRVIQLISDGYNARVHPYLGGFYHVTVESFSTRQQAIKVLRELRAKNIRVWLLES